MADEFDPAQMSDQEILSLPESSIPAGKLDTFLARRIDILERREARETGIIIPVPAGPGGHKTDGEQSKFEAERREL